MLQPQSIPIQKVNFPNSDISNVSVLRLDTIDLYLGGNKYFKLLYNIEEIKKSFYESIITFGGAYSNHLAAFASLKNKFPTKQFIAIVRGDESMVEKSLTLTRLRKLNIKIQFVHAGLYRELCSNFNHDYFCQFKNPYILPEGGSNDLAVKGCEKIAELFSAEYNQIILPIATGATMAGIISNLSSNQIVHGIAVLKGKEFLQNNIDSLLFKSSNITNSSYTVHDGFHHGGYAKRSDKLLQFVSDFNSINEFQIEPIYSGKLFYAIRELVNNNLLSTNEKLLAIHTGGLQYIIAD